MKWFKHDSNANMDSKLQEVLLDYGLEGYGLYWYCIELISSKVDKDNITFAIEHDARIIARNTGSTVQKVNEMMNRFVELNLFENTDGIVTCMKLARRLDQSMTSNPEMRGIINQVKSHDSIMTKSGKVMQDKIRLDKNRIEKNKDIGAALPKINTDYSVLINFSNQQIDELKRIRKANKGGSITQRVADALAKEFNQASLRGFTIDQCLTEWELRGWKSFKSEWLKSNQQKGAVEYSEVTVRNIETFKEWMNE